MTNILRSQYRFEIRNIQLNRRQLPRNYFRLKVQC